MPLLLLRHPNYFFLFCIGSAGFRGAHFLERRLPACNISVAHTSSLHISVAHTSSLHISGAQASSLQ